MSDFRMSDHNYYDNAETSRNRWFNTFDENSDEDDFEYSEKNVCDDGCLKKREVKSDKTDNKTVDSDIEINKTSRKDKNKNIRTEKNTVSEKINYSQAKENAKWHDALTVSPYSESTLCVLNNIFQNVSMAADSIRVILPYVKNKRFQQLLDSQADKYTEFLSRALILADEMDCDLNKELKMGETMARLTMRMKLLMNNSTSAIASMMIQGTTMGVINMGKLLRHTADIRPEALALAREVMEFEEDKIEILKHHL